MTAEARDPLNGRMYSRIGLQAPLHSAAPSKVLLADLPDSELAEVVAGIDFIVRTPNTIRTAQVEIDALAVMSAA